MGLVDQHDSRHHNDNGPRVYDHVHHNPARNSMDLEDRHGIHCRNDNGSHADVHVHRILPSGDLRIANSLSQLTSCKPTL